MGHESIQHDESNESAVIQLGSRAGEIQFGKGGLHHAEQVRGLTKGDKNGNVLQTLQSDEFKREVYSRISKGETNITLDLSREAKVSDETVEALTELRDKLHREHGITLTLTGVDATRAEDLQRHGIRNNGLEIFTEEHTVNAFKKADTEEKVPAARFDTAA